MTSDPSPAGRPDVDPLACLAAGVGGHSERWLAAQQMRVAAAFPPETISELEATVRAALGSHSLVTAPLQRGRWCFRFDAAESVWLRSPARDDRRLGPWDAVELGVGPRQIDPTRASNFVVCPYPSSRGSMTHRAMIRFSPGGADAAESREFDLARAEAVADGFRVPRSVHQLCWDGPDALIVSRRSVDDSGATRWVVHRIKRERPRAPRRIHEFAPDRVVAAIVRDVTATQPRYLMTEWLDHRRRTYHVCTRDKASGPWIPVPVPTNVRVQLMGHLALLVPLGPWPISEAVWNSGDLLAASLSDLLNGDLRIRALHRAAGSRRILQLSFSRQRVLISEKYARRTRLLALDPVSGAVTEIATTDAATTIRATPVDVTNPLCADDCWIETVGPLTPPSLVRMNARRPARRWVVEEGRSTFADTSFTVSVRHTTAGAVSPVEYVVVAPADMPLDGENPTIISAYGGFQAHERIDYLDLTGPTWLDRRSADGRRCVFVHAFIGRGAAALDAPWTRLSKTVDHLLAVAAALDDDGIAHPARLGATGVSHGGLIVMNAMLRRPSSFGAVACRSAVLDLLHYPELDGTAWTGEYGDPRLAASRKAMLPVSPYHQIASDRRYPPVLLWSSANDDRVSPVHSRKAAARLDQVGADVLYLETARGGHDALGSTSAGAHGLALTAAFFRRHLCFSVP